MSHHNFEVAVTIAFSDILHFDNNYFFYFITNHAKVRCYVSLIEELIKELPKLIKELPPQPST